jgi:hypothetical protein
MTKEQKKITGLSNEEVISSRNKESFFDVITRNG